MKKILASLVLASVLSAQADEWMETLEAPLSGDRVVIGDNTYILMNETDFNLLQEKFTFLVNLASKRWKVQHASEQGRRDWHGAKVHTTVTTNEEGRTVKVVEYADGYKHTETGAVPRKPVVHEKKETPKPVIRPTILQQLKARRAPDVSITKEVK